MQSIARKRSTTDLVRDQRESTISAVGQTRAATPRSALARHRQRGWHECAKRPTLQRPEEWTSWITYVWPMATLRRAGRLLVPSGSDTLESQVSFSGDKVHAQHFNEPSLVCFVCISTTMHHGEGV